MHARPRRRLGATLAPAPLSTVALSAPAFSAGDGTRTCAQQCKNGGWATSARPTYQNQGRCASSFAEQK